MIEQPLLRGYTTPQNDVLEFGSLQGQLEVSLMEILLHF